MKIQVQCRHSGDPRTFLVGARRLEATRVLERAAENSLRRFRVRVFTGVSSYCVRTYTTGDWRLAGVRAQPR